MDHRFTQLPNIPPYIRASPTASSIGWIKSARILAVKPPVNPPGVSQPNLCGVHFTSNQPFVEPNSPFCNFFQLTLVLHFLEQTRINIIPCPHEHCWNTLLQLSGLPHSPSISPLFKVNWATKHWHPLNMIHRLLASYSFTFELALIHQGVMGKNLLYSITS